ncbi:hypothetical protein LINPERHAP2_LOCUS14689 [Linum perenne]
MGPPPRFHVKKHQLIIHSQPPATIAATLPPTLPPPDAATLPPSTPVAALPHSPLAAAPLPPPPLPSSKSPQSFEQGKKFGKIKIKLPPTPPVFTNLLPGDGSNTMNKKNKNKNRKKKDGPRLCWPCQLWFKGGKALGGHRRHRHPKQIILALPAPNAPILALPAPPHPPPPQAPPRVFAPNSITISPTPSKHQESNLLTDASSSSTITQEQELEDPDLQDVAQTLLDFSAGSRPAILGKRPLLKIDEVGDLKHNINDYKMMTKHMHKKMRQQFVTLSTNRTIPDWDLLFPIQQGDMIHPRPAVSGPNRKEEEESIESIDAQNLELELATGVRNNPKEDININQLSDSA